VAGLQVGPEHNTHFEGLFKVWIGQLGSILPAGTNIPAAYERGSDQDQDFVQNLAIFLTTFFKVSLCILACGFKGAHILMVEIFIA
jgi:exportin-1